MADAIRWEIDDRYGNPSYLIQERWEHIIDPINHPEINDYEEELKETIRQSARKQDIVNPQNYRYRMAFTHIVAIVLFRFRDEAGEIGIPPRIV